MPKIPQVNNQDSDFQLYQTQAGKALQPALTNPINEGTLLSSVSLASGTTTVPHKLNRTLQGWFIVRQRAQAAIWDSQDSNTDKTQTLVLNSSAAVVVDLWVF